MAPFLARHGDPSVLSKEQKIKVSEECLSDLRKRLVDVANIIQSHFERVSRRNVSNYFNISEQELTKFSRYFFYS